MMYVLLIANALISASGNLIYTTDVPVIIKIGFSQLCFIVVHTLTDKGNMQYKNGFTLASVLIALQFMLPLYSGMFFSKSVQIASTSIAAFTVLLNSILVRKLLSKGWSKILSSRISTTLASVVEMSLFAYLLEIGLEGAFIMAIFRVFYVYGFPLLIFRKPSQITAG